VKSIIQVMVHSHQLVLYHICNAIKFILSLYAPHLQLNLNCNKKNHLQQIDGVPKERQVYLSPFKPFCTSCIHMILAYTSLPNGLAHYSCCNEDKPFYHDHSLQCIVETQNKKICDECVENRDGKMQTICRVLNALLNM